MKRRQLLTVLVAAAGSAGCSEVRLRADTTASPTAKPMSPFTASEHPAIDEVVPYELAIHEETNRARTERGVSRVEYDPQLAYVSRRYSQTMAEADTFDHGVEDDPSSKRLEKYGILCSNIAENLSLPKITSRNGQIRSPKQIALLALRSWLTSKEGHRENLLNPEWNYEGIGVYVTADNEVYVTQTFTARDCDGPGDPPRYDGDDDG